METIIFDFNGVIADPNYRKLITELPLLEKISALRVLLTLAKNKDLRKSFNQYKKGKITTQELEEDAAKYCPKSAYVVPKLLKIYSESVKINQEVISAIKKLKENNIKVLLMSNTIPETEQMILGLNFDKLFDGLIMSAQDQMVKPQPEIFQYAIEKYNLNPLETLMIDDKQENLDAAAKQGIHTLLVDNTEETLEMLNYFIEFIEAGKDIKSENITL